MFKNSFIGASRPVCHILVIFLVVCISSCSGPSGNTLKDVAYGEIKSEVCRSDPGNQYHILVPANTDPSRELPLVIILDAHGDGRMAVEKFRPAVRAFPCLVAGSDRVRNNFPGFESAVMQLLDELIKKYPVDRQHIIISGFSGGARMAYYFALNHPVHGVLMCGAGPGQEKLSCPVYTISGMGDFNFSEQYLRPDIGSFNNEQFTSDYFHGIHEWPQAQQLSDALVFLLRDLDTVDKIANQRSRELVQVADSLEKASDEILAWKALEKAAKLSVNKSAKEKATAMGNSLLLKKEFREAIRTLEHDLNAENQQLQAYSGSLLTEDTEWWKKVLTDLNDDLAASRNGLEADHYTRIKGYIGILLFSAVNYMIHNDPGNSQLEVMLDTYAFAEPENPDVYFFRALRAYQSGDRASCRTYLDWSLELGFSDRERLEKEFPADLLSTIN